ncbi:MAG TPA: sigma-70 family RNA polymerase sigma factor [Sumerlaeia bacterium]|nr:sigma-70 family RNA polymerase sigma factor [Sumerlaeia bacterium]
MKKGPIMADVDQGLFKRARDGDRDAFWSLILPYRGLIYSVALGMLRNAEQAGDELHDVLLIAFRSVSNLRDPAKLPSWLYAITRNHIYDRTRREKRLRLAAQDAARGTGQVVAITEITEKEEWLTRMERAMERLPEPFRVILGMKYMNDYSCREIADILDITVPAVKSRLFEARKVLRKNMEALASRDGGAASRSGGPASKKEVRNHEMP